MIGAAKRFVCHRQASSRGPVLDQVIRVSGDSPNESVRYTPQSARPHDEIAATTYHQFNYGNWW
jgi:hypothetical protein